MCTHIDPSSLLNTINHFIKIFSLIISPPHSSQSGQQFMRTEPESQFVWGFPIHLRFPFHHQIQIASEFRLNLIRLNPLSQSNSVLPRRGSVTPPLLGYANISHGWLSAPSVRLQSDDWQEDAITTATAEVQRGRGQWVSMWKIGKSSLCPSTGHVWVIKVTKTTQNRRGQWTRKDCVSARASQKCAGKYSTSVDGWDFWEAMSWGN